MGPTPTSRSFGALPTGKLIEAWTLTDNSGLSLEAITCGGIVTKLLLQTKSDDWLDLFIGFSTLQPYLEAHPCFGAIIGRVAGRISNARFRLHGQTIHLAANDSPSHLHGGIHGFDRKLWAATPFNRSDGSPSIRLTRRSPDGEEGYPAPSTSPSFTPSPTPTHS